MRVKTTVNLPEELLKAADRFSDRFKNRSEFIEAAVREFVARLSRIDQNAGELEILNRNAERLNDEALDALSYQVPL